MTKVIDVIYKEGAFRPLDDLQLEEGTRGVVLIDRAGVVAYARRFSGIGKYKGKLDRKKLDDLEVEIFG